jgi:hypothetical protein
LDVRVRPAEELDDATLPAASEVAGSFENGQDGPVEINVLGDEGFVRFGDDAESETRIYIETKP